MSMSQIHPRLAIFAAMIACCASFVTAADWPQFLGPTRNGISTETGLIKTWPTDGPPEVWRQVGGGGMSGVAIADGQAITLVQRDDKQLAVALDAQTGKTKWETELAPFYKNQMGNGPRGTPAVADGSVYVFTGEGILAALNAKTGALDWKTNAVKQNGGRVADYGMACSPLVVGDNVIVTVGAEGATVVAYNRKSGDVAWKSLGSDPAGYSSPTVLTVAGKQQLIAFTGASAIGVEPLSGKLLWKHPYKTAYECNIATPLLVDGDVFISSGENHGSVLLNIKPSGKSFAISEVWASNGGGAVMRNEWQTSVLLDGYFYGLDNVGSAGPVTNLVCVEARTGKGVWRKPRFGKSNLTYADGKLFLTTMKGELVVVAASPKGFDELGRVKVMGMTRQAPALANGRIYVRDEKDIICFDVRAK
ncbi:MAG: PQQ-binding-like beta-propeller repeat protein [Planctomycetota bacterium]|nr:PQQ-binding-like beta-propeller repeat protein [Planctomycetota bacterium]